MSRGDDTPRRRRGVARRHGGNAFAGRMRRHARRAQSSRSVMAWVCHVIGTHCTSSLLKYKSKLIGLLD